MSVSPLVVVGLGILALLLLVLRFRVHAFPALILVSMGVGLAAGLAPDETIAAVTNGMGGTLGFVAVVVGLGAMLGALLEASGGVAGIARSLIAAFGEKRASPALGVAGLIVAIPVFFDVALIIIAPIVFALARRTGKAAIVVGLPLLAGMGAGHTIIPPTPGPLAAAELLGADIGWVIGLGLIASIPAVLVGGPLFAALGERAGWFGKNAEPPPSLSEGAETTGFTPVTAGSAFLVVLTPLLLILLGTLANTLLPEQSALRGVLGFVGHPFTALLIACGLAFLLFGVLGRVPSDVLHSAMGRSLEPAGVVILVTGAGGAFKQVLVDTGAGRALAEAASAAQLAPLVACFGLAAIVRIAQGSATVAMITGAGLVAPIAAAAGFNAPQLALATIAVASGALVCSHVNDSGFWLVSRYFNMTEAETLKSWTACSTITGLTAFAAASALFLLF